MNSRIGYIGWLTGLVLGFAFLGRGAVAAEFFVDLNYDQGNGPSSGSSVSPFTNITEAVNAANTNGTGRDQIYIADGVYQSTSNGGFEDFGTVGLVFSSWADVMGGYAGITSGTWDSTRQPRSTIIDLAGTTARAFADSGLPGGNQGIYYDGLTFRNASNSLDGAAIICNGGWDVSIRVNDCLFTNNTTTAAGGALRYYSIGSWGYVRNSDFIDNHAGNAGAIYLYAGFSANSFSNCLFRGNTTGGSGGAIYAGVGSNSGQNMLLDHCVFEGNRADADGGAIFSSEGAGVPPLQIYNCVFLRNGCGIGRYGSAVGGSAFWHGEYALRNCLLVGNTNGHAIAANGYRVDELSVDLWNCTIADNPNGGVYVYRTDGTGLRIRNSIIANNGPSGIYYNKNGGAEAVLETNNVFGQTEGYQQDAVAGAGSISADPKFVNPGAGDYTLAPRSPCINTASDIGLTADLVDHVRPYDAKDPGFDMGCFEAAPPPSGTVIAVK
jgi:predicted outer membrane repeat protein